MTPRGRRWLAYLLLLASHAVRAWRGDPAPAAGHHTTEVPTVGAAGGTRVQELELFGCYDLDHAVHRLQLWPPAG